jgi:hypothetical protein
LGDLHGKNNFLKKSIQIKHQITEIQKEKKNNFIVIIGDSKLSPPPPGSKEDFGHLSNSLK